MKKSCGQALREARRKVHLTQNQVAKQIGVTFSALAHIEAGRRRPALKQLSRLADVLHLDRKQLLLIAYPEAVSFFKERHRSPDWAWQAFKHDRVLLVRHHIRPHELKMLEQIKTLGPVRDPRDFFFVLNSIRQATVDLTF